MKKLAYYIKIYGMIVSRYIKTRMSYRADFIISVIGIFFRDIIGLAGLWIIFGSIPQLEGWSLYELIFLYSFSLLAMTPLQIFFDNIWGLRHYLIDGSFIKFYFRPLNTMFYFMSERLDIKGIGQVFMGLGGIIYASVKLGIVWSTGKLLLAGVLLFSSSLILISMMVLATSAGFWVKNSFSIMELTFKVKDFSRYPTSIFSGLFHWLFSYIIPVGFISYYPLQALIRPVEAGNTYLLTPLIGLGLFAFTFWVWERGVGSYSGTGS